MKVEVAVLGSPCLIVFTVSVDLKQHWTRTSPTHMRAQLCGRTATLDLTPSELRSCVKAEVDVLGSPSLISLIVSVHVKQQRRRRRRRRTSEFRSGVKVEVAVLGSPSLTVLNMGSVDVKQHWT